jgi:hypothetical protein
MGVAGLALGVLPFTALALGLAVRRTGPVMVLTSSNVFGLTLLALVWVFGRAMHRLGHHDAAREPV